MGKTLAERERRVFKTIEQGELVGKFDLSAKGITHTYELTFSYSFNYRDKEGGLTKLGITRNGNGYIANGYQEQVKSVIGAKIRDDFPNVGKAITDDLVSEAFDLVTDICKEWNWEFHETKFQHDLAFAHPNET